MGLHLFHFSPHGLVRAFSQLRAGRRLCRRAGTPLRGHIKGSVNSMTAAWNFAVFLDETGAAPPATLLDIGANEGQMCRLLDLACPSPPRRLSFEPNPELQPPGERFELALSDHDGEAELVLAGKESGWGTLFPAGDYEKGAKRFKVRTARLESLADHGELDWAGLPRPIMAKIDTEGSEWAAVEGMGRLLRDLDYLLIEVENRGDRFGAYSPTLLAARLYEAGFTRSRVLYACYDGPDAPAYLDTLFWKFTPGDGLPRRLP